MQWEALWASLSSSFGPFGRSGHVTNDWCVIDGDFLVTQQQQQQQQREREQERILGVWEKLKDKALRMKRKMDVQRM